MSAGSDDTNSPVSPRGSVLGRDVEAKLAELSAGNTSARIALTKERAERRAAQRKQKKTAVEMAAAATKQLEKLTRDQELDEQAKIVDRIALRGLQVAEGLLKNAGEEGYNADADVPLPDATTRTHFGMAVYKQMMANRRENMATARALGVVVLQGRMGEAEWNAEAQRVDEEQRRAHAIDVAAEMIAEADE
jgi:uncharacterized small protein (DUF1192 family)